MQREYNFGIIKPMVLYCMAADIWRFASGRTNVVGGWFSVSKRSVALCRQF